MPNGNRLHRIRREAGAVLVVPTGSAVEPLPAGCGGVPTARCLRLGGEEALSMLRSDPFAVSAVVLSGDGESPLTTGVLRAIKDIAPRIPIVFLDERESTDSELSVRRIGVHYYTHTPADVREIAAVLTVLTGEQPVAALGLVD